METLQIVCDIIILIAAVMVAVTNICKFLGRPLKFFQKRQKDDFDEKFKKKLDEEFPRVLEENKDKLAGIVSMDLMPILNEIREMNSEQNKKIETIANGSKDVLRDKIIDIFNQNKNTKTLTRLIKKRLIQYYKDYKAELGNSYIDEYFEIMDAWEVIEED